MKYKVLGVLVLVGIAIQFVPYGREHTNPKVVAEPRWDSPATRELFFKACSNCHSNETVWPWYSNIAPVSWLIQRDVDEGREYFNISMWGVQEKNKGDDAAEEIEEGKMPPWFYLLGNPSARLSEKDKEVFIKGLRATFGEEKEEGEHPDDRD